MDMYDMKIGMTELSIKMVTDLTTPCIYVDI
jgi:hypothetical protein